MLKRTIPVPTVAVLGFKNLAGKPDEAWLSTAISEMLTTNLASGEELRLVPGETVAQMKNNLALGDAESYAQETLDKIRRQTSADDVVIGSYLALGPMTDGKVQLDLVARIAGRRNHCCIQRGR